MLDNIPKILQTHCQIKPDDLLLIGLSGGPDSLCLLHVLHQFGQPLIAVHINHQLRPEADHESQVVEQFARDLGITFISRQIDVMAYADVHSISVEDAARTLRYRLLFEQAETCGASAVAVAHTADDQVETILMHLLRGSGLGGLRGMEFRALPNPWNQEIPLVRPLLSTWRDEIQEFLDAGAYRPITDYSNLDKSFFRNRLRHELLPILREYNPSINSVLLRMGQILRDDHSLLQKLTDDAWKAVLFDQGNGYLSFQTAGFLEQPLPLQRNLLRRAIACHLPGLTDVDFECIERGISAVADSRQKLQVDLFAGLRLIKDGDQFWVTTWQVFISMGDFPAINRGENLQLSIPSSLLLNNGWRLEAETMRDFRLAEIRMDAGQDPFQAWLAAEAIEVPLIVRARKPGDRIKSLGQDGHTTKISDLMINLKIPSRARQTWPLVCSGDEIVWVPGYRISHLARVKPDTSSIVHLTLTQVLTT